MTYCPWQFMVSLTLNRCKDRIIGILRFLVYQNAALFSTFRPSVPYLSQGRHHTSSIWWFRPNKPNIFWKPITLAKCDHHMMMLMWRLSYDDHHIMICFPTHLSAKSRLPLSALSPLSPVSPPSSSSTSSHPLPRLPFQKLHSLQSSSSKISICAHVLQLYHQT